MSNSVNGNGDGAPRSSHLSPTSATATLSPTWRPPKSPLPPHRLAKLANALGVSTPVPASHSPNSFWSRSFSEAASSSSSDQFRRSPTPSTAASSMGFNSYVPSTSKFLLHVVPPVHLPHDSDNPEDTKSPPAPNTPGYHTQFRRGTLVPVHSTLQAQLGAIAKEYALPSTTGLILYLVTSSPMGPSEDIQDEPGPRLSEDIWRHLWTRVLRTEQRDEMLLPSRSATPLTPRTPHLLGYGPGAHSTPLLPQQEAPSSPLRPLMASPFIPEPFVPHAPQPTYPTATAPSTPSSISDIRSGNKSAPPSSVSQSEPGTPDTSVEDSGLRANSFDLPGLNSPSLIPILAKVEFDIDRRKAGWYDPWVRSRKANHAKRNESRKGSTNDGDGSEESSRERMAPIALLTGKKKKKDIFGLAAAEAEAEEMSEVSGEPEEEEVELLEREEVVGVEEDEAVEVEEEEEGIEEEEEVEVEAEGYARLSESPQELEELNSDDSDLEGEDEFLEDVTARVSLTGAKDPLADVFGTDADTWADIHAEDGGKPRHSNPHIVDLALTGEELSNLPPPDQLDREDDDDDDDRVSTKEEDDVREMLSMMGKPDLAILIPSPEKEKGSSSPSQMSNRTGKVPPPLVLKPKDKSGPTLVAAPLSPAPPSANSTSLAYMDDPLDEDEVANEDEADDYPHVRSPTESDKRGGAVFDDLDLGLDPTEDFDNDDPNDRRRSQIIMRAQLDEIERTLAQLSPRMLGSHLEDEQNTSFQSSATLSPGSPAKRTLSPTNRNSDFLPPPSPRLPQHPEPPESPINLTGQSWPAVPFSSIKERGGQPGESPDAPPSPPRLAVNGITTSAPKSYMPTRVPSNGPSESDKRKKDVEDNGLYVPTAPGMRNEDPSESPVIPLSPDPFGRYPSPPEPPLTIRTSGAQWDTVTMGRGFDEPQIAVQGRARSGTSTSRFSSDSTPGEEPAAAKPNIRSTLMSVKTIKKLFRQSNGKSSSSSSSRPPTPGASSSGRSSPMVPQRPERPSEEQMDLPDMPEMPPPTNFGRLSPQPMVQQQQPRSSLDQMNTRSRQPSQDYQLMPPPPQRPSLDQLGPPGQQPQFQQFAPYPGRNPNNGPIITPYMQASRSASTLDRLHFDQESPYPIRRSPRPPSPPPLPAIPEQEKEKVARKSILKWKSSSSSSNVNNTHKSSGSTSEPQPRSSFERPGGANGNSRGRRPSVINFGSSRGSGVTSPDLPTSPQIPSQYANQAGGINTNGGGLDHRASQRSRLTNSSADVSSSPPGRQTSIGGRSSSPRRSMSSSRDSQGSRPSFDAPSFDASQFEFVSPKAGMGTLTYPYNSIDQQ